jgi:hypothetical protein
MPERDRQDDASNGLADAEAGKVEGQQGDYILNILTSPRAHFLLVRGLEAT